MEGCGQALVGVLDSLPLGDIGGWVFGGPVGGAGAEEGFFVGEVAVDGLGGDAGVFGYGLHRGAGGA